MRLTYKALINGIAESAELDPKVVKKATLHLIRVVTSQLAAGQAVTLPDLGQFVNQGGVVVFIPSPTLKTHLLP